MRLVLLSWIIGSGLFFAGWFFGVIMARRHAEPTDDVLDSFCQACYLRQIEAQVALDPVALAPTIRSAR
jgi:hypothetical protein